MGRAERRTSLGRRTREAPSLHPSASQRRPERPGCSPGWFKSRGKPATTGAQPRAWIPAAELPPCSAPRTQAQRSRPYPSRHIPARAAKPLPRTFPGTASAPRLRRGSRAPRLTCALDPGAARRGAGRRRARGAGEHGPQTQTLLLSGRRSRHFLAERVARPGP